MSHSPLSRPARDIVPCVTVCNAGQVRGSLLSVSVNGKWIVTVMAVLYLKTACCDVPRLSIHRVGPFQGYSPKFDLFNSLYWNCSNRSNWLNVVNNQRALFVGWRQTSFWCPKFLSSVYVVGWAMQPCSCVLCPNSPNIKQNIFPLESHVSHYQGWVIPRSIFSELKQMDDAVEIKFVLFCVHNNW